MTTTLDFEAMISERSRGIDVSGIRRVFELGAKLRDPINLSIGQPDFPVPEPLKRSAMDAIAADRNGYSLTQGGPELLGKIVDHLRADVGWSVQPGVGGEGELSVMVTSGTSGALLLANMALLDPGDEIVLPDPHFVIYPAHARLSGGRAVYCDTYPDFRLTAERVEPLLSDRTKAVLVNSPGNPSGVVLRDDEMRELAELCESRNVMLITDEIYDEFTFSEARHEGRCPSPARHTQRCLLVRGFGKSYGCTGWRLGYVAGPTPVIREMMKLQQYTFVCAPAPLQIGAAEAFGVDMSDRVNDYARKRDMVVEALSGLTEVERPGGAFYAFVKVPPHLGLTATEFVERAIERNVLIIPGGVFSHRDTHFRLSFAASDERLQAGLAVLRGLMEG